MAISFLTNIYGFTSNKDLGLGAMLTPLFTILISNPTIGKTIGTAYHAFLGCTLGFILSLGYEALFDNTEAPITGAFIFLFSVCLNYSSLPVFIRKTCMMTYIMALLVGIQKHHLSLELEKLMVPCWSYASGLIGLTASVIGSLIFFPKCASSEVIVRMRITVNHIMIAKTALVTCLASISKSNDLDDAKNNSKYFFISALAIVFRYNYPRKRWY